MREPISNALLSLEDPKGSSLRIVVPPFTYTTTTRQILPPDSIVSHSRNLFSFLLPRLCFARGTLYARNLFLFAANQSFDSSRLMVAADIADSKLCALIARHATKHRLPADAVAQLGKGRAFGPPRCIPSCAPEGAAEPVPVSAPFGPPGVVAFRSWEVCP
jgi:hypothetical protein